MKYALAVGCLVLAISASSCGKSEQTVAPVMAQVSSNMPQTFEGFQSRQHEVVVPSLDVLGPIADRVVKAHPGANPEVLRQALWQELKSLPPSLRQRPISPEGIKPGASINGVSAQEAWLLIRNPRLVAPTAAAADYAQREAAARWPGLASLDTRQDAFRHSFWNVLLCLSCGESWASAYTTAHEGGSTSQAALMDLNNNAVGRMLYRRYGGYSSGWYSNFIRGYRYVYVSTVNMSSEYLLFFKW